VSIADPPEVAAMADTTGLQRLDRLIQRLLDSGESAAAAGEWDRATETALDVLAVDPANTRAQRLIDRARDQQPVTGQRALITLLFSDLVGSTPLAEAVQPETMRDLYRAYRDVAHGAVERYGGQVIQFQGDGIVACFGHPEAHEDDARRAVLAGLALLRATPAVARQQRLDVQVRVGVHTGMAVVANFGAASVGERGTIVGTPPNVAARLQSVAAPGTLVVSDVTHHLIEADFETTSLGLHELKGITRPIEVFTVAVSRHPTTRLEAARFHRGALVGRDDARARLVESWAAISEQPDRPIPGFLVRGDAGVGKSRLAADLRRHVEAAGGGILETGCSAYHSRVVFWPAARMIERELELTQDDDTTTRLDALREALRLRNLDDSVLALLAPLLGIAPTDELPLPEISAPALRHQQIELLLEWLRRLAAAQLRLLLVEDLQWSDPSTAELLGRIAADPPPGVLLVLTSRSEPAEEWRHALVDLPLSRLTNEDAGILVDTLSGGALTDEQRDTIVDRGEGMPLFLEELTVAALTATGGALPMRLNELFTSRLKAPGVDLRLAQMAATIGASFEVDLLQVVAGEDCDVEDGLRRMQKVGLVEPVEDGDDSVLRFRHVLLRDAAYETQVLDTRRDNHARVAAVLAGRPSATEAPPAVIAYHLDRSGAPREAIGQYFIAADQANKSGANAEALELVGRALELCGELPAGVDRDMTEIGLRLLRVLCASSLKGYGAEEVGEDTLAVAELGRAIPACPLTVTALIVVWSFVFTKGELPKAAELLDSLQRLVEEPGLAALKPDVDSVAGYQAFYEGRLVEARELFEEAIAHQGDTLPTWPLPNDPLVATMVGLACVSTLEGDREQADRWERAATERAEAQPFPRSAWSLGFTRVYGAWMRTAAGDPAGAHRLGQATAEVGLTHGFPYFIGLGGVYLDPSTPKAPADRVAAAERLALLEAMGHRSMWAVMEAGQARADAHHGSFDEAMAKLDAAEEAIDQSGERVSQAWVLLARAEVASLAADEAAEQVVAALQRAHDLARGQGAHLYSLQAAVGLAELPDAMRPADWRERLVAARSRIPATSDYAAVVRADELLARG
jgi:class 3 adenylate cyclase/tetratricopeptide (TPR) repeat protein